MDAFYNGSSPRTRRFDKDRRSFWHTSREKLKKIYSFSMGSKFIRIPLLMFWPGSIPSDFHKIPQDPNAPFPNLFAVTVSHMKTRPYLVSFK